MGVLDGVAVQAFRRINTSVSITMASYISKFLTRFMTRAQIVLASTVVLGLLASTSAWPGLARSGGRALTTARSVVAIVVTTTVMRAITDVSGAGQGGATGIVLGTSFVLAMGSVPQALQDTSEGVSMLMGMRYAYADTVMAALPGLAVRTGVAACLGMLIPFIKAKEPSLSPPLRSLAEATTLAGVSLIIWFVMPELVGNVGEDLVKGVVVVLLVHSVGSLVPGLGNDVGEFVTWTVARRFSTMFEAYGIEEAAVVVGVVLLLVHSLHARIGGLPLAITVELLTLVAVFVLAAWVIKTMDQGHPRDAITIMASFTAIAASALSSSSS